MSDVVGWSDPPVVPGYAVTRPLGRGATCTVWAAVEDEGGEQAALKIPDPTAYRPGELLSQAAREIAVLEGVASEHVVRLRRVVHLPTGGAALVLDLAGGGSLADLVTARGRLSEGEVATVCTALATTLAALHDAGVIHGDLAAGNVLFTREGKPMIADFACARLVGESDPPLVAGTAGFVAPEVARGDIPTEASDAYALGALAWFALTGVPRTGEPPDEGEAIGFLGRHMGPVVRPLLSSDPQARPGLLEAAGAFYGAVTPIPVGLVDGPGDSAVALTRRIRAQAATEERSVQKPARRRAPARSSRRRRAGEGIAARAAWWRTRVTGVRWATVARVFAVGLAMAALFGVGRTVGTRLLEPPPESATAATSGSPAASETTATSPPPTPAELLRSDPRAVLAAIADARAAALMMADGGALERSEVPGSAMHRHDTQVLATLSAANRSYAGLSFTVRSAELLTGEGDTATVRAVVDRSAYQVLGPGEQSETVAPQAGAGHTYQLALVGGTWRLVTIE